MSVGGASRFDRVREFPIYDEVPRGGSWYQDFPPPPAPVYGPLASGPSLASLGPPPPPAVSLDPLPAPPLPTQPAVGPAHPTGPEAFYPPSEDEGAEPDNDAMDIKPVHRFVPDSVKNFFRGSSRSSKRWSLPKSDKSSSSKKNGQSSVGVPCSPPHSAPPSPSLPGSYRGSYTKEALLLGADAIDSVSHVPSALSSAQTYAERVELYHQRYAYMKSWAGLLRILGGVQLLLGAAVFACVCAYVHKDNEWFNMYGYSSPQLYGGLGGAYGAGGTPYTGPKTPFVLVVAGLAWVVTVILLVLGVSLYYRTILLDSPWWPLTECAVNVALAVLYFAAGAVYVRDTTRGGMCNLPVFNNGLNGAFCRVEAGQTAAIVFLFLNAVLYLVSAAVCLKLWRHEAARLRRQEYALEMKTIGSSEPLSILGGSSHHSNPTPLPTLSAVQPDLMDGHAPSRLPPEPEILRGHIPAGHIPRPVVIADYVAKYPSIRSVEEREKYRAVFNDQYAEYKELHAEVQAAAQRFDDMDAMMRDLQASAPANQLEQERINGILLEYNRKKNDPTLLEKRERCEYLKKKLSHIKQKISEYNEEQ